MKKEFDIKKINVEKRLKEIEGYLKDKYDGLCVMISNTDEVYGTLINIEILTNDFKYIKFDFKNLLDILNNSVKYFCDNMLEVSEPHKYSKYDLNRFITSLTYRSDSIRRTETDNILDKKALKIIENSMELIKEDLENTISKHVSELQEVL